MNATTMDNVRTAVGIIENLCRFAELAQADKTAQQTELREIEARARLIGEELFEAFIDAIDAEAPENFEMLKAANKANSLAMRIRQLCNAHAI